ncbi:NTP transferase domain-containing protein [Rhodovastum atsumiense]|uniref:NTP transferase domain-containing protein n=1 Tax=Rhodovastum atsumiense TaxID=504468 RepID=A0A5M6ILI8_9PROT|nr:molybdopterin-binding/glycosyltransferase family 2 protein [Rhodovastum atsumiense]KAA5608729.1 NTP transferase domain-containing protein [Rhodovastum atsumiense]CAH2604958.1 NTP transferase domain-containing protein [Rhodovastum atsumiense]
MIFATFPLAEALGAVLAHSHRLPGRVLKKGAVLDAAAIAALREAGRDSVVAARFEPDDVAENEAAERLAAAVAAPGLQPGRAGTGRVNLHATGAGLLRVEATQVDRINAVHESLTLGTLPDDVVVAAREMVATIKVIPFAVPGPVLAEVEQLAAAVPALTLHPFRPLRAGLVLTELPGLKESVTDATIAATEARVSALSGTLLPPLRCPHAEEAIAASLRRLLAGGAELLLVAGASATVDRRDVGPAGVVRAGGAIDHFGMPVDPGNLICLGHIGTVPAYVLPGCARSPRPNGIDRVLARVFAGLPVGAAEVMRMGVGGLLKDTSARPLPRARAAGRPPEAMAPAPRRPRIAAVVLAAGTSTRMGPRNKLLVADRGGKPMIARVVDNVLSSAARPVVVVTGHQAEAVRAALGGRPVGWVQASDYAAGLSASLKAGIAALPEEATAALVCLGDMPLVTGRMIDRLLAAYDPDEGRAIVVPTHQGQAGNPVLWDRAFFPEILALSGDKGARELLRHHAEQVVEVEVEDAVLRDFDTPESLARLPQRLRPVDVG